MQEAKEIGHREIKAIIFDMDNTLFDFVEAKLRACKAVVNCINQTDESLKVLPKRGAEKKRRYPRPITTPGTARGIIETISSMLFPGNFFRARR